VVGLDAPLGKVTHFFDKISVAIVALTEGLAVGEKVKFVDEKHGVDFEQTVNSLQLDHKELTKAEAGTEAAVKTIQPVKEGTLVFKL